MGQSPHHPEGSDEEGRRTTTKDEEERPQLEALAMVPHYGGISKLDQCSPREPALPTLRHHSPRPMPFQTGRMPILLIFEISYVLIVIVVTMSQMPWRCFFLKMFFPLLAEW